MLRIKIAGMEAFVSQAIWSNDSESQLLALTLNGREMAVRGIVASFLTTRYLTVKTEEGQEINLAKGGKTFTFKGGKISPEFYQALMWNKDDQHAVIRKTDFYKYIDGNFTTPFHPAWVEPVWKRSLEMDLVWPLSTIGIDGQFFGVGLREETLQAMILENFETFKGILKNQKR